MKRFTTAAFVLAIPMAIAVSVMGTLPVASAATATAAKTTTLKLSANPKGRSSYNTKSLKATTGTIVIKFTNQSKVLQNVTVEKSGKKLGATPTFTGGTKTLTLKNLGPGKYTYYCSVSGRRQAGMSGTLTVKKYAEPVVY